MFSFATWDTGLKSRSLYYQNIYTFCTILDRVEEYLHLNMGMSDVVNIHFKQNKI